MMNPVPWLQMTNMISYQGLVRTFLKSGHFDTQLKLLKLALAGFFCLSRLFLAVLTNQSYLYVATFLR